MRDLLVRLPWGLIGTAAVLILATSLMLYIERRRDKRDRRKVARVEGTLADVIHIAQTQHTRQYGRPNTELTAIEATLPPAQKQGS